MSFDVVKLLGEMDKNDLVLQLGLQCAPLIAGMKASNLFTVASASLKELERLLKQTELSFQILYEGRKRAVVLIYKKKELSAYISTAQVKEVLSDFGYSGGELADIFLILTGRYENYMRVRKEFPHELGLLLEYPIEDVLGFIRNNGKNYLYSGYWKVYKDKEKKVALFEEYERVQTEIARFLYSKMSIYEILAFYQALNQGSRNF